MPLENICAPSNAAQLRVRNGKFSHWEAQSPRNAAKQLLKNQGAQWSQICMVY